MSDPQLLHRHMIVEVEHPVSGKFRAVGNPVKASEAEEIFHPPPALGEHTEETLRNLLVYDSQRIEQLTREKVIIQPAKESKQPLANKVVRRGSMSRKSVRMVKNLGVSVVVSGLFSLIRQDCQKLGLARHTVNYSLGVWGKKERLPDPKITQITTMCGHGLVSFNLVQFLLKEVRGGKKTIEEASAILAKACICGVFNSHRAAELLQAMIEL